MLFHCSLEDNACNVCKIITELRVSLLLLNTLRIATVRHVLTLIGTHNPI